MSGPINLTTRVSYPFFPLSGRRIHERYSDPVYASFFVRSPVINHLPSITSRERLMRSSKRTLSRPHSVSSARWRGSKGWRAWLWMDSTGNTGRGTWRNIWALMLLLAPTTLVMMSCQNLQVLSFIVFSDLSIDCTSAQDGL